MASKYYQGKFTPKNPSKYTGNPSNIVFRSSWERALMRFCDRKDCVKKWSSETCVVPYISPVDNKYHRYFIDFQITFSTGETYLIEVKPSAQTKAPTSKRKTKRFVQEVMTYGVNQAKWEAADKYAKDRNQKFAVWTEHSLKALGIPLNVPIKRKKK
jgi:hypothetical protein